MNAKPLILLLTDFSEASFQAFPPTVELAERIGAHIHLVHMVQDLLVIPHGAPLAAPVSMTPEGIEALGRRAEMEIEAARERLGNTVEVQTAVLCGERVEDQIGSYAEEHAPDFIAMATHGRSGIRRVLMGSVAEAVMRHTKLPLWVFPLTAP